MFRKFKISEQGGSQWLFAILLVAVVVIVIISLFGAYAINTTVVLEEIEREKTMGILIQIPSSSLPPELKIDKRGVDQYIVFKYFSIVGDGVEIPGDQEYAAAYATNTELATLDCGDQITSVGIISKAFEPEIGAAEAGAKVSIMILGGRAITNGGCEVGPLVRNPLYDENFEPYAAYPSIWNIPGCLLRVWTAPGIYRESSCLEGGYRPTANWQRIGAIDIPNGQGLFRLVATDNGLWMHAISTIDLNQIYNTYGVAGTIQEKIKNILQKVFGGNAQ